MRKISAQGLALIKQQEGKRLRAYKDVVGVLTIGYGHTGPDVHPEREISEDEAESLLRSDLDVFERAVHEAVHVPLNENEFAAIVSLTYNIGVDAFRRSTVLRRLNQGDRQGAADAILLFERAGGRVQPVLQRRRRIERELFLKPSAEPVPAPAPRPAPAAAPRPAPAAAPRPAPAPAPAPATGARPPPPSPSPRPAPPAPRPSSPPKPLTRSRTLWGSLMAAFATIGSMAMSAMEALRGALTTNAAVPIVLGVVVLALLLFIAYARVDDHRANRR